MKLDDLLAELGTTANSWRADSENGKQSLLFAVQIANSATCGLIRTHVKKMVGACKGSELANEIYSIPMREGTTAFALMTEIWSRVVWRDPDARLVTGDRVWVCGFDEKTRQPVGIGYCIDGGFEHGFENAVPLT